MALTMLDFFEFAPDTCVSLGCLNGGLVERNVSRDCGEMVAGSA